MNSKLCYFLRLFCVFDVIFTKKNKKIIKNIDFPIEKSQKIVYNVG